ncbi:MAG: ABC transporter ATP-binding protein [Deltaproteobacteria bacterium]|nr:ABC transporter ATP-binding protein [Deltaproteobacteria bacterium]
MPAIELRAVRKRFTQPRPLSAILRHPLRFERIQVLDGVDLSVPRGSLTGLLGPNGAGKTTLLRILAGSISPDAGELSLLGIDALRHPRRALGKLGVVLGDERSFFWRLTAEQNLQFFAALHDLHGKAAKQRIRELAQRFGLEGELGKAFRNLSTGWRHRLALARALLHDPEVLLMDEPTSGLDPGAAERACGFIAEQLVAKMGKTVLLATHKLDEARQICDRLALLARGHILYQGSASEALARTSELYADRAEEPA